MIDIVLSLVLLAALVYVVLYVTVFSKKEVMEIYGARANKDSKTTIVEDRNNKDKVKVILNGQNYTCDASPEKTTCYNILNPSDSFKIIKGPTNDILIKVVNNKSKNFKKTFDSRQNNPNNKEDKVIFIEIK